MTDMAASDMMSGHDRGTSLASQTEWDGRAQCTPQSVATQSVIRLGCTSASHVLGRGHGVMLQQGVILRDNKGRPAESGDSPTHREGGVSPVKKCVKDGPVAAHSPSYRFRDEGRITTVARPTLGLRRASNDW